MSTQISLSQNMERQLRLMAQRAGIVQPALKALAARTEPLLRRRELLAFIKEQCNQEEVASALGQQMIHLGSFQRRSRLPTDRLLESLHYTLLLRGWAADELSSWDSISQDVGAGLESSSLKSLVKILDLSFDYISIFDNSRMVVDIRPVFNSDYTSVDAAIISSTLQIDAFERDGPTSFSCALDLDDIVLLREVCDDALTKIETLKKQVSCRLTNNIVVAGEESDAE